MACLCERLLQLGFELWLAALYYLVWASTSCGSVGLRFVRWVRLLLWLFGESIYLARAIHGRGIIATSRAG